MVIQINRGSKNYKGPGITGKKRDSGISYLAENSWLKSCEMGK